MLAEPTPEPTPRWGVVWRPELPDDAWARWDVLGIPEGLFVSARCRRCGRRQEWWPQDTLSGLPQTPEAIADACRTKRDVWLQMHQSCDRATGITRSLHDMGWVGALLPAGASAWMMSAANTGAHPYEVLVARTGSGTLFVTELPRAGVSDLFSHVAAAREVWGCIAPQTDVTEAMRVRETAPGLLSLSLVTQHNGVMARAEAQQDAGIGSIELAASPLGSWTPGLEGICRPLPRSQGLGRVKDGITPHPSAEIFLPLFLERLQHAINALGQFHWDDSPES